MPTPENRQHQEVPRLVKPRLVNGQFPPGASGNPGGRPAALNEVRDLARKHTAKAVANLAKIADSGKSEMARIAASVALLDRGWGRPTQPIAGDDEMPPISVEAIEREREEKAAAAVALIDETFGTVLHGVADADR
jgi:hypothetical protein